MNRNRYADRPNLLRVATEISKKKHPEKILKIVELVVKGGLNDFADSEKDLSLLVSEVIAIPDKPL